MRPKMDHMVSANVWYRKETLKPHSCPRVLRRQQNDHFQSSLISFKMWSVGVEHYWGCDCRYERGLPTVAQVRTQQQAALVYGAINYLCNQLLVQSTICAIDYLCNQLFVQSTIFFAINYLYKSTSHMIDKVLRFTVSSFVDMFFSQALFWFSLDFS